MQERVLCRIKQLKLNNETAFWDDKKVSFMAKRDEWGHSKARKDKNIKNNWWGDLYGQEVTWIGLWGQHKC